jgi:hypothetical protein
MFLEILLLTWPSAEALFGLDPWVHQDQYAVGASSLLLVESQSDTSTRTLSGILLLCACNVSVVRQDLANKGQVEQDAMLRHTVRRVAPYGNTFMVQGASPAAADDFPDGFFDFMYGGTVRPYVDCEHVS